MLKEFIPNDFAQHVPENQTGMPDELRTYMPGDGAMLPEQGFNLAGFALSDLQVETDFVNDDVPMPLASKSTECGVCSAQDGSCAS